MKKRTRAVAMALALALVTSTVPAELFAFDVVAAGNGGTNAGQPFPVTIMNGGHYRIPAMVTLSDGTLVAAADARWHDYDTTDDNGDIDTIVSYSTDNGATWTYSFANYIDNGDTVNYEAATFIDPSLAVKNVDGKETVFMLVDLFPGQSGQQNCTASAEKGTGFDDNGNLLLSTDGSSYSYYLKDGKIYQVSNNSEISGGYTVDAKFNLYQNGTLVDNLFNYGSPYKPLMTSYLYLTKSTDGGKTWSDPQLLNHGIKTAGSGDRYYICSPGRGLVTSDGTIIFPCYDANANASFIYSTDNGETWKRSGAVNGTSSESEMVELEDGTLRMFIRHYDSDYTIKYVDATKNMDGTYSWGNIQNTGIAAHNNTNVTAITYSQKVNGQQCILFSCPGSTSGAWSRQNGKIFAFTVGAGNAMTLINTYEVNGSDDAYSYSCLTELSDGSIGLLYEKGDSGNITYTNLDVVDLVGVDAEIGNMPYVSDSHGDKVTAIQLSTIFGAEDFTVKCIPEGAAVTVTSSNANIVAASLSGKTLTLEPKADGAATVTIAIDGLDAIILNVSVAATKQVNVELELGQTKVFTVDGFGYGQNDVTQQPTAEVTMTVTDTSTPATKKLLEITSLEQIVSGGKYLICTRNNKSLLTDQQFDGNSTTALQISTEIVSTNAQEFWTIEKSNGKYTFRQDNYLTLSASAATMGEKQELSVAWSVDSWLVYTTINGNNYYLNNFSQKNTQAGVWNGVDDGSRWYICEVGDAEAIRSTKVSFTGEKATTAPVTATVGYITYNITVKLPEKHITIYTGQETVIVDESGSYAGDSGNVFPDSTYVSMQVENASGDATVVMTEITELNQIVSGSNYLIGTWKSKSLLTDDLDGTYGLDISSEKASVAASELWTITQNNGSYHIAQGTQYINISSTGATMGAEQDLTIAKGTYGWVISKDGYYLNNYQNKDDYATVWTDPDQGSSWYIYKIEEEAPETATKITFIGNSATGDTPATAWVGNTVYYITVLEEQAASTIETTPVIGGQGQGAGRPMTGLVLSDGTSYDLDLKITDTEIHWSSTDESVVTVDENGTVTGVAAGEAKIIATVDGVPYAVQVTVLDVENDSGDVRLIEAYNEMTHCCTAYYSYNSGGLVEFPEGTLFYVQHDKSATDLVVFLGTPNPGYALTFCNATAGKNFHPVLNPDPSGTRPYGTEYDYSEDLGMKAGGYVYLYDQLIAYVANNSKAATAEQIKTLSEEAAAQKAEGAFFFSRSANQGDIQAGNLSFAAERLPEVNKTLNGILPGGGKAPTFRRYAGERMTGEVGDYVYFTISITQEAPRVFNPEKTDAKYSLVEFSLATLTDTIVKGNGTEYYFYTKDQDTNYDGVIDSSDGTGYQQLKEIDVKDDLNSSWTDEEIAAGKRVKEYYVVYKIVDDDLELTFVDGKPVNQIENSATCTYSFESYYDYSKGTTTGTAAAAAHMLVVGEYVGEFVVDFGLPLVITITGAEHGNTGFQYMDTSAPGWYSAKYGKVDFLWKEGKGTDTTDDDVFEITYTPTSVLPTADEVLLYREEGEKTVVNSFSVVPATSVYYEDTFIDKDSNWASGGESAGLIQDTDTLGDVNDDGVAGNIDPPIKKHPYGYDDAYKKTNGPSNGTQIFTGTKDATASFTFTGTGFELYANCSESTGTVQVYIRQQDGDYKFTYIVNTAAGVGSSAATSGQTGKFYSLPIVSLTDLERGTYTVTLTKLDRQAPAGDELGKVYIDGFRVFGTVKEAAGKSSLYFYDQEDHPEFIELRDSVLTALDLSQIDQNYLLQIIDKQIFDQRVGSAIIVDPGSPYGTANAQDLLDNGPKNELFLWERQALTFKVTTKRLMQIGLKAPQGATDVEITVNGTKNEKITAITSSVDMFYELNSKPAGETTYTVTITNMGSSVLSVTKLKICDDPDATFENLTAEDIEDALIGLDLLPERTYADATANVTLVDYAGNEIGSVVLHKNGAVGRAAVFTAAEILAAARQQLPEHYAFVNEEAVMDAAVAFGSSRTVFVQVGQVATVRITYISLSQRKVCTVTVTKVQFTAGPCRISATELKRYSPFGRTLLVLGGISAQYGQVTEVTVTVL